MKRTAFKLGEKLFAEIDATIQGHVCMYANEAGLLAEAVRLAGNGDHLEIGSMWGGSAVLAALVKQKYKLTGKVVCVDPFRDGDCSPGFPGGRPDEQIFWANMDAAGVADRIELHTCYSDPWPFPAERRFASIFVDGDHLGHWPLTDWHNARQHTDLVIYHDLYPHERDVMAAVAVIRQDPEWAQVAQVGSLAVFGRVAK